MPAETQDQAEALAARCRAFVPPDAFDAHAHLYPRLVGGKDVDSVWAVSEDNAGWSLYQRTMAEWLGDRAPSAGLFFGRPKPELDIAESNRFVAQEVARSERSRGLMLVRPTDDPDAVAAEVERAGFAGFKVYHVYAERPDTFYAEIDEYLPEWMWRIADQRGLAIMLHMVKPRALADEGNQKTIQQRCRAFPNARLILAHAARGFCSRHTTEAIHTLRGLDNVFFDTSAVCEPEAFEAILETFGPRRLMFGTDFPVSEKRDKCVTIGDGFLWVDDAADWKASPFAQPMRVGVESVLALQHACHNLRLGDPEIERIFRDNALELLGITRPGDGSRTQALYEHAKKIIPGGTQLLSKRSEMQAPDQWPAYFREARGCEVVDLDGRRFIEMSMSGIGSCLLGYNDPDVTDAVMRRVQLGAMSTLNPPEEVELADRLLALHPWAEQARFARAGGEAMAVAVRVARAATGRDRVAICGYHGWSDWYLAANLPAETGEARADAQSDALGEHLLPGLEPAGVPRQLGGTTIPFRYNRLDELEQIVAQQGDELAAVVMEPTRSAHPEPGFLEGVRALCDRCGAVLVIDEITAGWRFTRGGAHLQYGLEPDVAVFAKALGNGHPMAAVIGRASVMEAAQRSFISSTYWTESVGPTAALAVLAKMERVDVVGHVHRIGERMRAGWQALNERHGLSMHVRGHAPLLHLGFDHADAAALGTLFTVRMLRHGFLAGGGFYPSLAHEDRHVDDYLAAADAVLPELVEAAQRGDAAQRIGGPVRHSGFARLT